jgi:hypothetical protein
MKIAPHGSWMVLTQIDAPEEVQGLALTDGQKEKIRDRAMGLVSAVGPDVKIVKPDEVVAYDREGMNVISGLDGVLYILIKEEHIIGKVLSDEKPTQEQMRAIRERQSAMAAAVHRPKLAIPG